MIDYREFYYKAYDYKVGDRFKNILTNEIATVINSYGFYMFKKEESKDDEVQGCLDAKYWKYINFEKI